MIVDVHTHLSTSAQWGPQFRRAIELTYPPTYWTSTSRPSGTGRQRSSRTG